MFVVFICPYSSCKIECRVLIESLELSHNLRCLTPLPTILLLPYKQSTTGTVLLIPLQPNTTTIISLYSQAVLNLVLHGIKLAILFISFICLFQIYLFKKNTYLAQTIFKKWNVLLKSNMTFFVYLSCNRAPNQLHMIWWSFNHAMQYI